MTNHERYGRMLQTEEAGRCLQEQGSRMTAQRRAVLQVLSGNRTHPTADEIATEVRTRLGCLAPATIYNTLDSLEELGFIRRLEGLEARTHFDPDTSDHQHAICSKCKRVWDIAPLPESEDLPEGFKTTDILIQGICRDCFPH